MASPPLRSLNVMCVRFTSSLDDAETSFDGMVSTSNALKDSHVWVKISGPIWWCVELREREDSIVATDELDAVSSILHLNKTQNTELPYPRLSPHHQTQDIQDLPLCKLKLEDVGRTCF